MNESVELKRSLSLPIVIFYGLGTMVGGGIYALAGKVAGEAGMYAPVAFTLSSLLALLTAFSYAELVARYPLSAGEVNYAHEAWGKKWFSKLIGFLVVATGIVSAATLTVATAGFLQDIYPVPVEIGVLLTVLLLGGLAYWGINESAWVIVSITFIELGGLLFIVTAASGDAFTALGEQGGAILLPSFETGIWAGILAGSFLAFYAFIGFEDMVNIAEEVKSVQRNLPIAIIVCILSVLFLYVLISLIAVLTVPVEQLASSKTPMDEIIRHAGVDAGPWMVAISLLAGVNGALVQIIMVSRVLFGMAKGGKAPAFLAHVSQLTHTPTYATIITTILILVLALIFDLSSLARITSLIVLFIFTIVNLALIKIRQHTPIKRSPDFQVRTIWLPMVAALSCGAMFLYQLWWIFFV
jgi:amino acid transporter